YHGGSANVYIFNAGIVIRAAIDGFDEGIEIDDDKVNVGNAVIILCLHMIGVVAHGQDAAVNGRVQGFDAAIHHFGKAGMLGDFLDRNAGVLDGFIGAAGGEKFDAVLAEFLGEFDESGFVGYGNQRAFD